jgi:hypothetical protein
VQNLQLNWGDFLPLFCTSSCFECGKQGHIKSHLSITSKEETIQGKTRHETHEGIYCIFAWDDNDISSSNSESGEQVNLALMMSHHSDDEEDELVITKTLMMMMMYKKQLKNYSRLKSKKID